MTALSSLARVDTAEAFPVSRPGGRPATIAIYMHDLSGGGVERQSLALATELQMLGFDITMVLHQMRGELREQLSPHLRTVDLASSRTIRDIPRLAGFLSREKPDVLLANVDHNNVAALLAKAMAASRTKVVICQHNPISADFYQGLSWTYRGIPAAYRAASPLIARAVGVSRGITRELEAIAHLPAAKLVTINNPVIGPDFAFRSGEPVSHPWLEERAAPVFVCAGRLVPQKDHQNLLHALALHRQHAQSRLLLLGTGPLRESLEALAAELGIADAVMFLGFQDNPLPWFRRADAFVLSSRSEGFGNVLVESLWCGTPVIATDCPHGPSEILDGGRFGVLVPPNNPAALAAAMDETASMRKRFPPTLLKARAAEFTNSACAARYAAVFRSIVPRLQENAA
ncbi:MAG: glycosyltransferase [Acetobacteraceae bacterium]|nr:glycosyltransferase [Acetobacteraceae bacterium]